MQHLESERLSGLWAKGLPGFGRAIAVAVGGPAAVTLLAVPERQLPVASAALLYVSVVAVAAGVSGASAGVAASLFSFLALNFFFTPPLHTFNVGKAQDLVALLVFLLVSVITGLLLSRAVREKVRAERREQQTRLLNQLTSRLLSGEPLEAVVRGSAESLAEVLGLADCEIETAMTPRVTVGEVPAHNDPHAFEAELIAKGRSVGRIRVRPREKLDADEQALVQSFAGQLALALESMRLSNEVQRAELDAETNRLRAALFSGVTHDLKTPLAAITASVTSLIDGSGFTPDDRFQHLDTIKQEVEHLDRVVTNLMDLARLRAGALIPAKVPGAIDEVIEAVVTRLHPLLDGRDVHLNLREDLPELTMDIVQIEQVLTNLIENAVKFSPPSTPIYISAVGGPERVRITVADMGSGIPPHDRERIFQPFERGDSDGSGTGLGLAIARAAVVAHGGRMWVGANPGGGAALTFELPVDASAS